MTHEKYDIFISYSRKDTKIADQICAAFDSVNINYFIDRKGIGLGDDFVEQIIDKIDNSQFFLLLASKNAYNAKYTPKEIHYAIKYKHNAIIPYIIDDTPIPKKYYFLMSDIHYISIKEYPIESTFIDKILAKLGRERKIGKNTKSQKNAKENPTLKFDAIHSYSEGLAVVRLNSKVGYINEKGKLIIPLKFDYANSFKNGKAKVKLNGEEFYINKRGNPIDHNNKLTATQKSSNKTEDTNESDISTTGATILGGVLGLLAGGPIVAALGAALGGVSSYFVNKNKDTGNTENVENILKYDAIHKYSENLAAVRLNSKVGYIDMNGKLAIPLKYDFANSFKNGKAMVKLNGEYFYIDKNGNRIG